MDSVLKTESLTKKYLNKIAVNDIGLTINRGDIYGLVGLNGSGKTTFIRLITGLVKPNAGSVSLFGSKNKREFTKALSRVGSIVETPAIYLNLNAYDNVNAQAALRGIKLRASEIHQILDRVGLEPTLKKIADHFSLGMRQRLGIAVALASNPEFLVLDEPTNGLDPEGIYETREVLQKLSNAGITILISSHILSELGKLATRFGFIHNGKLIKETTAQEILSGGEKSVIVETQEPEKAVKILSRDYQTRREDQQIIVSDAEVYNITKLLHDHNITFTNVKTEIADLERYFINLIGGLK